jgi:hypothetical protein
MTAWMVDQKGAALFWPLLVASIFYWILAIVAGVKAHKAISVWLDRRLARQAAKRLMST